jgi:hypothetical protein
MPFLIYYSPKGNIMDIVNHRFISEMLQELSRRLKDIGPEKVYSEGKFKYIENIIYKDDLYRKNVFHAINRLLSVYEQYDSIIVEIEKSSISFANSIIEANDLINRMIIYFAYTSTIRDLICFLACSIFNLGIEEKDCSWKLTVNNYWIKKAEVSKVINNIYGLIEIQIKKRNQILHEFDHAFIDEMLGEQTAQLLRELAIPYFKKKLEYKKDEIEKCIDDSMTKVKVEIRQIYNELNNELMKLFDLLEMKYHENIGN